MINIFQKPCLGVALGAGAGKGWSHLGVLKVLHREKIPIHAISGSSAGALVAAMYAAGKILEFEEFLLDLNNWTRSLNFFDFVYPSSGFIRGDRISHLLDDLLREKDFSDLSVPLYISAVDIIKGEEIVFSQKDLKTAIRSSVSLPIIMKPVRYQGKLLVDGGVLNPVPVDILRKNNCNRIIAVDLSGLKLQSKGQKIGKAVSGFIPREKKNRPKDDTRVSGNVLPKVEKASRSYAGLLKIRDSIKENIFPREDKLQRSLHEQEVKKLEESLQKEEDSTGLNLGIYDILMRSFTITQNKMFYSNMQRYKPDIILSPDLNHFRLFDFHRAREAIAEGERVAMASLEQIKKLVRF